MLMEAPTETTESLSRRARTVAPAIASTALTPMARSSVLFPDMLEPLTSKRRVARLSETSLQTHFAAGMSG